MKRSIMRTNVVRWIPYKTFSGVPLASILSHVGGKLPTPMPRRKTLNSRNHDPSNNQTYVISFPTGQPQCAIAPNLTLTEGTNIARYESSTNGGTAGCVAVVCRCQT